LAYKTYPTKFGTRICQSQFSKVRGSPDKFARRKMRQAVTFSQHAPKVGLHQK